MSVRPYERDPLEPASRHAPRFAYATSGGRLGAEHVEIVVRGAGWTTGSAVLSVWVVSAGIASAGPVSDGARLAILAVGPVFAMAAAWAATSWRVIVATPEVLRVARRPVALWDVLRIPRRELAFVALEPAWVEDVGGAQRPWWRGRGERWSVVARTRDGRTHTIAEGYREVAHAKWVADQVSEVLGIR